MKQHLDTMVSFNLKIDHMVQFKKQTTHGNTVLRRNIERERECQLVSKHRQLKSKSTF